ncbi:hypothetical protein D4Q71_15360 [Rhodopseudomonas palustris]|nr:hypothetical protein D4Q71_15360 [Rhodopseudomonas palustris]
MTICTPPPAAARLPVGAGAGAGGAAGAGEAPDGAPVAPPNRGEICGDTEKFHICRIDSAADLESATALALSLATTRLIRCIVVSATVAATGGTGE